MRNVAQCNVRFICLCDGNDQERVNNTNQQNYSTGLVTQCRRACSTEHFMGLNAGRVHVKYQDGDHEMNQDFQKSSPSRRVTNSGLSGVDYKYASAPGKHVEAKLSRCE